MIILKSWWFFPSVLRVSCLYFLLLPAVRGKPLAAILHAVKKKPRGQDEDRQVTLQSAVQ